MNSYQRVMAAIMHEKTDRVPVLPEIIEYAAKNGQVPYNIFATNGKKLAEAVIKCLYRHEYDGVHISTDNQIISESLGCIVEFPYDKQPRYKKRILEDMKDLSLLKRYLKDFDPFSTARMPVIIEATRYAREVLGNNYFIHACIDSAPFQEAGALRGEEKLFLDLVDDEQYVYDLLEICTEAVVKFGQAVASAGAHALTFGDATAVLIGRENYNKYALPFVKRAIEELKKTCLPVAYHICGNSMHIIDLMSESGADILELDSLVNLGEVKQRVTNKVCLEGNINPSEVLLQGSPSYVYNQSIECIESIGNYRGFILSSGCDIPRETPPENIDAMVKASIDYASMNFA